MRSASFKVYARKPNGEQLTSCEKKRKQPPVHITTHGNGDDDAENDESIDETRNKKKSELKNKEKLEYIDEFASCLEQLIAITSKLNETDKNTATNMVIHRFFLL